jgi:hypothetical protein
LDIVNRTLLIESRRVLSDSTEAEEEGRVEVEAIGEEEEDGGGGGSEVEVEEDAESWENVRWATACAAGT